MRFTKLLLATVAFAAFAAPAAAATLLKFELAAQANVSWTAPASPIPDQVFSAAFQLNNLPGTVNGVARPLTISFSGSGLLISNPFFQGFGPQVFSGSLAAPTFIPGTYSMAIFGDGPGGTSLVFGNLTISELPAVIPEPASWALMIAGFGLVGSALRRRQVAAAE